MPNLDRYGWRIFDGGTKWQVFVRGSLRHIGFALDMESAERMAAELNRLYRGRGGFYNAGELPLPPLDDEELEQE